ncbi:MAG: NADPH-dependent FMN reductase [Balneolaceae bacterium]
MKIAILLGSVRMGRQTHKAAYYLADKLENRNIEADLLDLAEIPLPVMGGQANETETEENISIISSLLNDADALILVTPEYHGSFSGVLKNALDHFTPEFRKKPVGVVAASAGRMAGINASTQLQHVILSMGAYPMPLKLLVPGIHEAFDEEFIPRNEKIVTSAEKFLDEFIWFAEALHLKKTEEAAA